MANQSNELIDYGGNIFISYRRNDSGGHSGRIHEKLCDLFGKDRIFFDVDSIKAGEDFVEILESELDSCRILIAVIGKHWNPKSGEKYLLENPNDFVRLEIARAISRGLKIIPVFVDDAPLLLDSELPEELKKLKNKNRLEISNKRWVADFHFLLDTIKTELNRKPKPKHNSDNYSIVTTEIKEDEESYNPREFIFDRELHNSLNTALTLNKPLLLTGELGVGKKMAACKIAHDLQTRPLTFYFRSNTKARDVYYFFDSERYSLAKGPDNLQPDVKDFIQLRALGTAILLTLERDKVPFEFHNQLHETGPKRPVLLLDRIDMADKQVALDIMYEVSSLEFYITEMGKRIIGDRKFRPIIVFTANDETKLHEEFVRYCIFHRIPFPSFDRLLAMTKRRLKQDESLNAEWLIRAINYFSTFRTINLKKAPSLPEYFDWIKFLVKNEMTRIDFQNPTFENHEKIRASYSILAKNSEDLDM